MHAPQIAAIDRWIGANDISRPEAIRQLVEWALSQTRVVIEVPDDPPVTVVRRARENERRSLG